MMKLDSLWISLYAVGMKLKCSISSIWGLH